MSSDESEMDEETHWVKQFNVRKFSRESRKLSWAKRKLDKSHQDSLPGLSKRVMILREQGEPSSTSNQPTRPNCTAQLYMWLKMDQHMSQMLKQIHH
jgi:hypothetical protein